MQRGDDLGLHLLIMGNETRRIPFKSHDALVQFQQVLEAFLLQTGWSFIAFSPERRRGRDRRRFPRDRADRRRWWTDGRTGAPEDERWRVRRRR